MFLLFAVIISDTQAGWKKSAGVPAGFENNYYLEVYFLPQNQNYAWICGFNGVTLRSTDRGKTWQASVINGNYQLESIHFVNEKVGYTSGQLNDVGGVGIRGALFKSTDGGITWREVTPPQATDLWGNYFVTPNTGLVIGNACRDPQMFHRTTDGGATWKTFYGSQLNSALCDVQIFEENGLGYATSSGLLWITRDGGITWSVFSQTGSRDWQEELAIYNSSFMIPYSTGCSGNDGGGGVRISVDGGKNWRDHYTGKPMFGSFLKNELRGWAVGWDRTIIYTSNGGRDWSDDNCGVEGDLDDIWFLNDTTGWVVGQGVYEYTLEPSKLPAIAGNFPATLCEGDTLELSLTRNFNAYRWSTGENSARIKVTKPGTYWVYAFNSLCDSGSSAPVTVNFIPKPKPEITAAPEEVCEGDTMTLSVAVNFQNIKWSSGETSQSIRVTRGGKYIVAVHNGEGCVGMDTIEAVFNPRPAPQIISTAFGKLCVGDTVFMRSDRPYSSYRWTRDGAFISSDSAIIATETGSYALEVDNEFGCAGTSAAIFLDVKPDSNRLEVDFVKDLEGKLNFYDVVVPKGACKTIVVKNISNGDVTIRDAYIFNNRSFSIPQSQYPITIPAGAARELTICFTPDSLGILSDSVLIPDACDDHYIRLTGVASMESNIIYGPCDIEVLVTPFDYEPSSFFRISAPTPNPASDAIKLGYETNLPDAEVRKLEVKVYSFMGEEMTIKGLTFNRNSLELSLNDLPAGAYCIRINLGNNAKMLNFIKN